MIGFNKSKYLSAFTLATQLFLAVTLVSSAEAAPRCSIKTLIQRSYESSIQATPFKVSQLSGVENISLKPATITKLKAILSAQGKQIRTTNIKEIIEAAGSIYATADKKPDVKKSNKMAEIGREILDTVKPELNKAQYKMVNYLIAEAVMRLETIPLSEYKSATRGLPVFKKKSTIHIDKFNDLVESYVDGTAGYRDMSQDGGFLSWPEIRGLYTNNSWAIGIRDHDMYHLHYSYGHPYYLAVNMHASRTINDRRYAMISTLWEAVDDFRSSYEDSLAQYFKSKRMSAEDGMLFLASATDKELAIIEAKAGSYTELNNLSELAYSSGWRPQLTKFGRGNTTYTQETQFKEIEDYLNQTLGRMSVTTNKKYTRYHRQGPGHVSPRDENTIP